MNDRVVTPVNGFLLGCAVALVVAVSPAGAQQECEEFTLIGGDKSVAFVKRTEEGDSPGGLRILTRPLLDERGVEYGAYKAVSTVIGPGSGGDQVSFLGTFHFVFRDGELVGQTSYERANDSVQANPQPVTIVVNGGSGIYKGATGTVEVAAGNDPTFSFKIDCD